MVLAIDDEAIQTNPAHKLGKIMRPVEIKNTINPLTREELSLLFDTINGTNQDTIRMKLLAVKEEWGQLPDFVFVSSKKHIRPITNVRNYAVFPALAKAGLNPRCKIDYQQVSK